MPGYEPPSECQVGRRTDRQANSLVSHALDDENKYTLLRLNRSFYLLVRHTFLQNSHDIDIDIIGATRKHFFLTPVFFKVLNIWNYDKSCFV